MDDPDVPALGRLGSHVLGGCSHRVRRSGHLHAGRGLLLRCAVVLLAMVSRGLSTALLDAGSAAMRSGGTLQCQWHPRRLATRSAGRRWGLRRERRGRSHGAHVQQGRRPQPEWLRGCERYGASPGVDYAECQWLLRRVHGDELPSHLGQGVSLRRPPTAVPRSGRSGNTTCQTAR